MIEEAMAMDAPLAAPARPKRPWTLLADRSAGSIFLLCTLVLVALILGLLGFLAWRGLGAFIAVPGNTGRVLSLREVFLGLDWSPNQDHFGVMPFILGSLTVVGLSIALAGPLGILTAVFVTQMAPKWMRALLRQTMDLLVGIPSVVYGIFGLATLLPFLSKGWLSDLPAAGFLASALILTVMIIPTVVSLSMDAFEALPRSLNEGARALGSTSWQSTARVLIPAAWPRLVTAIVLGMGRAIGEAMAVQMVIGNNPQWIGLMRDLTDKTPILRFLFTPASTLTTELVQELPNTPAHSPWNNVLFALGLLLYLLTMGSILFTRRMAGKRA
ncbi:MAG TPA: phosphate ABC transporter permease subunit PstC [Holophagaceae bacterium]|nr:phosphate ABC transporter permease subunit PstC [Holophagaceae bacterium]